MEGKNLINSNISSISHKQMLNFQGKDKFQDTTFSSFQTNDEKKDFNNSKVNFQNNFEKGKWTREEHAKFIFAILTYGNNWKKVQQCIVTRTCSQARSHAQKFLKKLKQTNIYNCRVNSSLSSISNLQDYVKTMDNKTRQEFINFLNNLVFEDVFNDMLTLKKFNSINYNTERNINNESHKSTVCSGNYYPNIPIQYGYYPLIDPQSQYFLTFNNPNQISLSSPHLNNFNNYGFNMNNLNVCDRNSYQYLTNSNPPFLTASCYTLVYENGQYIYRPIPNMYGVIYPYQENILSISAPVQNTNPVIEKDSKKEESCLVTLNKISKNRIKLKKKKKTLITIKYNSEEKEKNLEKKKARRKKELETLFKEEKQINEEKFDFPNEKVTIRKNSNASNEIYITNSLCYNTSNGSEVSKDDPLRYNFNTQKNEPYEDNDNLENFIKKQCNSDYYSLENTSSLKRKLFSKEAKKNIQNENKKEDLLNCFNPSL